MVNWPWKKDKAPTAPNNDGIDNSLYTIVGNLTRAHGIAVSMVENPNTPIAIKDIKVDPSLTSVSLTKSGAEQTVTMVFKGENAAIMARPIHSIIHADLPGARRSGSTAQDREIKATGSEHAIQSAASKLAAFAEISEAPEFISKIAQAEQLALALEKAIPCKVHMDFCVGNETLGVTFTSIITGKNSEIVTLLKNHPSVTIHDECAWKTSDLTEQTEGVKIILYGEDGQKAFQNAAQKVIDNKPGNDSVLKLSPPEPIN